MRTLTYLFILLFSQISWAQLDWEHLDGPEGSVLARIISGDSFAYVQSYSFLYRTADGDHWEKLDQSTRGVFAIEKNRLYRIFVDDERILQISDTHGESWIDRSLPNDVYYTEQLAVCSHGIYARPYYENTFYRSIDDGITWASFDPPFTDVKQFYSFDDILYAWVDNSELWKTDADGNNWINITPPLDEDYERLRDMVAQGSDIIVSSRYHIYTSRDRGATWAKQRIFDGEGYRRSLVLTNDVVYLCSDKLWRSADFGLTWNLLTDDVPYLTQVNGFKGSFLAITSNDGVIKWDDQANRLALNNNGLSQGVIYALAENNDQLWVCAGNGLFSYDLNSQEWQKIRTTSISSDDFQTIQSNDSGWLVAQESYIEYFIFSEDNGVSWDSIYLTGVANDTIIKRVFLIDEHIVVLAENGLYISFDKGVTWTKVRDAGSQDSDFEVVKYKGSHFMLLGSEVYKSTDNGLSWENFTPGLNVIDLAVSEGFLYAITTENPNSELRISLDGDSWLIRRYGLPPGSITNSALPYHFFQAEDLVYMFSPYLGLFSSVDTFKSWQIVKRHFNTIAALQYNGNIYIGDYGLFKSALTNSSSSTKNERLNNKTSSLTISPNPTNSVIRVRSEEVKSAFGTVSVHTLDGRLMWTEKIKIDSGHCELNVLHLNAGTYLLTLHTGELTEHGRFIKIE